MVILFGTLLEDMIQSSGDTCDINEFDVETGDSDNESDEDMDDSEEDGGDDEGSEDDEEEPVPSAGYNIDCIESDRDKEGHIPKFSISEQETNIFNQLYDNKYTFVSRKRQKVD
jgi:hypothetical protein